MQCNLIYVMLFKLHAFHSNAFIIRMLCGCKIAGNLSILQGGEKRHRIDFGGITEGCAELGCEYNAYVECSVYIMGIFQLIYCTVGSTILLYVSCSYTACVLCAVIRDW